MTVLLAALVPLWAFSPAKAQVSAMKDFDAFVEKAMQDWQVPGLAVALVKDDRVVHIKAYGVREIGKAGRVDENTIFPIGSVSKAFTSAAVALMVQDGKLSWDDRVIDRLPGFQMFDPWVTREITVRDLLSNRGGVSELSEWLWIGTDRSRDEIVRRLRYVKPDSSFRSQYGYRNVMFLTAGQVIAAVTGTSWDTFVQERLFKPLRMGRSSTSVRDLQHRDNVITPHLDIEGRLTPVPFRNIDNMGPAGSVNSSITDMARWLRFQLANGVLDGRRIADAAVIQETHRPHTPIRITPEMASSVPWSRRGDYCLGWLLIDHQGDHVVYHNGKVDGIYAVIGFIPERQVGAVVLTNYQDQELSDVVFLQALDVLVDRPPKDWNSIYLGNRKQRETKSAEARQALEASRLRGTTPSQPVAAYAGDYENEMYGRVAVSLEGDHLVLRLGSHLIGDMAHWHYETFRATMRDRAMEAMKGATFVTFGMDGKGAVSSMNLNDALTFARVPERKPGATK
jgi:CubicO group peptidase (beta-lactamase class C family)